MKKAKFNKKLNLNKESIAKLNEDQMNNLNGGDSIIISRASCAAMCTQPLTTTHNTIITNLTDTVITTKLPTIACGSF